MKKRSKSVDIKEEPVSKKPKTSQKPDAPSKKPPKSKFSKPTGPPKKPFSKDAPKKPFSKDAPKKPFSKDAPKKPFSKDAPKTNPAQQSEKPDWKAVKEEKKQLKEQRKAKRLESSYDIAQSAKKIGEKLRDSTCTPEERETLIKNLSHLLTGNLKKFIFSHDISRIIQWLIKFCTPEMRQSIAQELTPDLKEMWMSKYAVNCIKKLLKHGTPDIKEQIMRSCEGRVVSIISHSVSAPIFNKAYSNFTTDATKNRLKQEFYGDIYKKSKDEKVTNLTDVFKTAADMKSATLSAVKINLTRILNKKEVDNTLVLTVLSEFLAVCSAEDRSEMVAMLRDSIYELSRTKEGSKIAMTCIWHGTTKDRKSSLKSMKDHVKDIAISEHGHVILLSIFDSVDDTVLMKKILLPELITDLQEIVLSEFGKKVVLYLVARRDTHHFHPQVIDQLKEGDGNAMSKKPQETREKELLEVVNDPLLESIAGDCNFWLSSGSIAMVTLAVLKAGQGENLVKAFRAIAEFLVGDEVKLVEGEVEYSPVEHPGLHMMLKKLIVADKVLVESGKDTFGAELVKVLDAEVIGRWIEFNRACFVLVLLMENEAESVVSELKGKLGGLAGAIKAKKGPGASILLKKIK